MKKTLVSILAAVMLLSVLPAAAFAEYVDVWDGQVHNYTTDLEYAWTDGTGTTVNTTGNVGNDNISYPVYAIDGSSITVEGNVTGNYIGAYASAGSVRVDGNVNVNRTADDDETTGINVDYGGDITVGGNVSAAGEGASWGVYAYNGSATVNGNVSADTAVSAQLGSNVTVGGNVSATDTGVNASGTVKVGGDVTTVGKEGAEEAVGVMTFEGADVTVDGNVSATNADRAWGVWAKSSNVTVKGNVSADKQAVTTLAGSSVTVGGDVSSDSFGVVGFGGVTTIEGNVFSGYSGVYSTDDGAVTVKKNVNADGSAITVYGNSTTIVEGTAKGDGADLEIGEDFEGKVIVGKLENGTIDAEVELTQEVLDKIFYIINGENVTVDGSKEVLGYEVTNEGNELIVSVAEGYNGLDVEGSAVVEKRDDGSYLVKVQRGGGLVFRAYILPTGEIVFEGPAPETAKDEDGCYIVGYRFTHFLKALVDGEEINADSDYTLKEESHGLTCIKLTDSFLSTLAAGKHTLSVVFTDGTFDIPFEV